ncbi:type II toxin-antitoxin system YafO family toxin [Lysobacter sp. A6]|uniref:Type II toxin-antitoxin system YafO family toxin n=1 Tax=Noviluteimonas lactosilytica TaxID=2888523 RepID=A0ABS8JLN5_9GAMM|nr:type II toxin-antitoxin system YafO family toxin [Lysobacter lactosilyticus]MCC8364506.1 type II toxin-antitoxin system YafO family toxin [Lysobacter lactosilyticus]
MAVLVTEALAKRFQDAGLDVWPFMEEFADWKDGWPAKEYDFELFGKDGMYDQPRVGGARVLWHVHLEPTEDLVGWQDWMRAFTFRKRKTSNRVLVYARRHTDYLLITILDEPDAHLIAQMRTPRHKALMESFAEIARAWIEDDEILA